MPRATVSCPAVRGQRVLPASRSRVGVALVLGAVALAACGGASDHESYTTLVGQGLKLLKQGNTAAATQKFQEAIARKSSSPVAYYDLGVVYQRQGKTFQARRDYGLAIHYDPTYVPALYNQAGLFANTSTPLAVFYYRRIIRVQPDSPTAYLNLGLLEAASPGLRTRALRDLAQAVKLDPALRADVPPALRALLP